MTNKLDFVKSVRFWKIVISVVVETIAKFYPEFKPIADAIMAICLGSVALSTLDKTTDKMTQ